MGLMIALVAMALPAEEPTKKTDAVKPPWQRMLQGEDAKKAAEQEKKLTQLQEDGRFAEALKVAETLAELRSNLQGADHWQTINARLRGVEAIRRVLKANKEEQKSYARAVAVQREIEELVAKGRYRDAQPLLKQQLTIYRKVLGEEYPDTASCYNNLGYVFDELGKQREAEEAHNKALVIFRKVLGEEHPDTANCYDNLAANLQAQGKYRDADEGFQKALAVRLKVLGEEDLDTALSYNNVASNLDDQGKYKEAEEGYRMALALIRKVLGEDDAFTATGYNNLAFNLDSQGKYKEAEEGFRKALTIRLKVQGEEHPDTARTYYNLASNLDAQGKYQEAEKMHRKALTLLHTLRGEEHAETANSYDNLAHNLQAQGQHKEAEEDHRKALAIRLKVQGKEHPDTAVSYINLARSLQTQGKYQEAEEDYRKGLAIRIKVQGEEHPNTANSYHLLAANLHAQGKYEEAETFFLRATESFDKARLHIAATGLERATFTSERSPLPALATVLARNGKPDDAWQRFEESLARGTWDDLTARLGRPQTERDRQAQINARIDRLNKLLEKLSGANPTKEQTKEREELLSQLRQAYHELAAFTKQLENKYGPIAGQVFPRGQIQESLPADAAFVAWLDISGQPKAKDGNGEHWAVLLRSSRPPVWVRLTGSGDKNAWTDADTQLPAQVRETLQSSRGIWQPLAERLRRQRLDPLAPHLKGVRRLIVLPSTALAGVPVEAIADGYTVSYAHSATMYAHLHGRAAPTGKGLFVLADPVFDPPKAKEKPQPLPPGGVLLTAVVPGSNAAQAGLKPNDVLLRYGETELAGPADFKPQPEAKDSDKSVPVLVWREGNTLKRQVRPGELGVVIEPARLALAEQRQWDRWVATRGSDGSKWDRLPGTRIEAASLHRLFAKDAPVQLLLDSDASEQRLNELAQRGELGKYRYVHLATHGEVDNAFPLRSAVILSRDRLPDERQRTELLLSSQPIPDGRLTAEEALQRWNLHSDLVTLSACQTALGKYERGEGFVGFAQALILCGTRAVCLSLWKVDDTATALLMERFYQNLLGKRDGLKAPMPKAAALAEAKSWLRTLPREEAIKRAAVLSEGISRGKVALKQPQLTVPPVRAKEKASDCPFSHPHYWASFILIGDPN
jgi:tetratricopeptide (TPR) repeat protein